ncbi:MAG: NUDIX domain-containing protein [Treponema sp.]|nr:NUDIX domain-containing protein [Treponema sp.]
MGYRNRSVAIVVRNGKILMERLCYKDANNGREFFSVPGGGIEEGETPEQTVLRELKEECGLDGTIVKPLAIVCSHERKEYSFEVAVPDDQQAITGYDPEEVGSDNPGLREVVWKSLDEINEKDRAFLFSYGLIQVQDFYETIVGWGNEISYPGQA